MFISIVKVAKKILRYIKTPETVAPNCVTINWHFTSGLLICKARWSVTETACKSPRNRLVMAVFCNLCLISLLFTSLQISTTDSKISDVVYNLSKESAVREPSVFLAIIARNAAHLLPNWLGYIENLDYPKNRISVW